MAGKVLCHPPPNSSLNTLGPRHPQKRRTTKASCRGQVPEAGTEQRCRGCSSARPQQAPGCCAFTSVAELLLLFESSSSYLTCSNSAFQRETTTLHIFEDSFLTHQSLLFSRDLTWPLAIYLSKADQTTSACYTSVKGFFLSQQNPTYVL